MGELLRDDPLSADLPRAHRFEGRRCCPAQSSSLHLLRKISRSPHRDSLQPRYPPPSACPQRRPSPAGTSGYRSMHWHGTTNGEPRIERNSRLYGARASSRSPSTRAQPQGECANGVISVCIKTPTHPRDCFVIGVERHLGDADLSKPPMGHRCREEKGEMPR